MHSSLLDRLQARGYRLTAQRRVIAQVLEGENVHLTADEVLEKAQALLPEISRATVYSTLQRFSEIGEVRELSLDGRSKRYDPNVVPAHHHLVCDGCGAVFDVAHGIEAPALPTAERRGMMITSAEVVYRGTCAGCT
jgi:Fur family ferric uptake transcriptional regulator